ncbi:MAG: glycine zipper 2TM domain-containing protein [Sphingomonas sp.]
MKKTLIGLTALAVAIPTMAATPASAQRHRSYQDDSRYERDYRDGRRQDRRSYSRDYDRSGYYTGRSWRDNRGQYRCRRSDGSTGLLIGAVGGALVGRTIDTRGDRTAGTLLGAVVGGLIGSSIEKDNNRGNGRYRCR